MATRWYRAGTITVTNGSRDVVGANTKWVDDSAKPLAGDALIIDSQIHEIEVITDNNNLKLFKPFSGNTASGVSYAIIRNASINISSRLAAAVSAAINSKQLYLDELNEFFTSNAPTMVMHDSVGDAKTVIPYNSLKTNIVNLVKDASSIAILVKQAVDSKTAVESAKNEVSKWRDEIIVIEDKIKKDKKHINSVKGEVDTVKGEVDTIKGQVDKVQSDVTTKKNEIDKLHTDSEKLRDEAVKAAQLAQAAVVPMRNEAEMWEMIRRNNDMFAASQFIDFGNHYFSATEGNGENINEGLWARTKDKVSANSLFMNRNESATPSGSSKVPFAVTAVAGFVSELYGFNWHSQHVCNTILFPEAPDGTVIYDSTGNCRGTGKANLDLSVDIDPKYGDVAADHNEAVARAFEGSIKNGDFRLGDNGDWDKAGIGTGSITSNGYHMTNAGDNYVDIKGDFTFKAGVSYECTVVVHEHVKGHIQVYRDGGGSERYFFGVSNRNHIKGNGTYTSIIHNDADAIGLRVAREGGGGSGDVDAVIKSIYIRPLTEEVVITPHDVFGMEYWLEEVTQANPDVFDCGMVQSKATSSNGVATSASSRPQTYHAAFKGDLTNDHKSVNFFSSTFEEQCKLAAKESNNLFRLKDGRIVQFRGRQKTFRGPGNYDWKSIDSAVDGLLAFSVSAPVLRVLPQGLRDSLNDDIGTGAPYYYSTGHQTNGLPHNGIYTSSNTNGSLHSSVGVFGLCFFQVWGEVPRLNKGAFHRTLNPNGCDYWASDDNNDGQINSAKTWMAIKDKAWQLGPKTTSDAFRLLKWRSKHNGKTGRYNYGYIGSGTSGRGISGRDDGRFYDGIYEGGQGGVIDYRVSASEMGGKEDASKVFLKALNCTYRGKERLRFTTVGLGNTMIKSGTASWNGGQGGRIGFSINSASTWKGGVSKNGFLPTPDLDTYKTYLVGDNGSVWEVPAIVQRHSGAYNDLYRSGDVMYCGIGRKEQVSEFQAAFPNGTTIRVVQTQLLDSSVSGEFEMMDVFAKPSLIATNPYFSNGWVGGWAGVPGSSPNGDVNFTKKVFRGTPKRTYWVSSSGTWSTGDMPNFNSALKGSDRGWSSDPDILYTFSYRAFADPTKVSVNKPILNASQGLGDIWTVQSYNPAYGCVFAESLFGKTPVSKVSGHAARPCGAPYDYYFSGDRSGKLGTYSVNVPRHQPIEMPAPTDESPAIKVMWSQASVNQQATLQFNWNELVYHIFTDGGSKDIATNFAFAAGSRYRISSDVSMDFHWYCSFGLTAKGSELSLHPDGKTIVGAVSGNRFGYIIRPKQQGDWGDDSTIRIKDNVGTFINLNGDTCLYGTSELAIPYGFTKNKARAGEQVEGVDL
ncbi:TPA: hypothetical protein P0E36_004920 [Vibrio harveyi]|nr:hypothetical protein [Vibrio harveyi]